MAGAICRRSGKRAVSVAPRMVRSGQPHRNAPDRAFEPGLGKRFFVLLFGHDQPPSTGVADARFLDPRGVRVFILQD